jgi:hypothetical protein
MVQEEVLPFGSNKLEISRNIITFYYLIYGVMEIAINDKATFKQRYNFPDLANDILEVLDFLKLKPLILSASHWGLF